VLLDLLGSASVDVEVTDEPLASIIDVAAHEPSLIAMATRGHDSIGDVLRGSHTERVVRDAKCPVLCVPA
jgi:nucleotide-binding universal stress UspA family protein